MSVQFPLSSENARYVRVRLCNNPGSYVRPNMAAATPRQRARTRPAAPTPSARACVPALGFRGASLPQRRLRRRRSRSGRGCWCTMPATSVARRTFVCASPHAGRLLHTRGGRFPSKSHHLRCFRATVGDGRAEFGRVHRSLGRIGQAATSASNLIRARRTPIRKCAKLAGNRSQKLVGPPPQMAPIPAN